MTAANELIRKAVSIDRRASPERASRPPGGAGPADLAGPPVREARLGRGRRRRRTSCMPSPTDTGTLSHGLTGALSGIGRWVWRRLLPHSRFPATEPQWRSTHRTNELVMVRCQNQRPQVAAFAGNPPATLPCPWETCSVRSYPAESCSLVGLEAGELESTSQPRATALGLAGE